MGKEAGRLRALAAAKVVGPGRGEAREGKKAAVAGALGSRP